MPLSLAAVGQSFAEVTFEWLHGEWNLRGLLEERLGAWVVARLEDKVDDLTLHVLRENDKRPARGGQ